MNDLYYLKGPKVSKAQNPSVQVVPFVPIALQLWLKDSPLKSAFGIIITSS